MKIQDFIKERHYYCLKRNQNIMYFKVVSILDVWEDVDVNIGARCINQFEKDGMQAPMIIIRSGLFPLNITQEDLDNGKVWEISREELMEAAINMAKYSLKEF